VPVGPLAVRWVAYEVPPCRAGTLTKARVALENAGSAVWRSQGTSGLQLSYHWLDERGNPIVWDGLRVALPQEVGPGGRVELDAPLRAPIPPGGYRLAFDLVDEGRLWLAEIGNTPLELAVEVAPRIAARTLAVRVRPGPERLVQATGQALAAQEEAVAAEPGAVAAATLAPGCAPAPDWSRRILDAHAEGYAAVGGSVEPAGGGLLARRRAAAALAPWAPGPGRVPAFSHPLLCASVLTGVEAEPADDVDGLPAVVPPPDEPWLYDGRIRVRFTLS
jgi:hypothetical protein